MAKGKAGGKAKKIRQAKMKKHVDVKNTFETRFERQAPPVYKKPIIYKKPVNPISNKWRDWTKDFTD